MGRHDMVWPAARPVEEVSVFARWTSEGAAPKDRPPLFFEGRIKVVGGAVAPSSRPVISVTFPVCKGLLPFVCRARPPSAPRLHLARVRPSASRRSVQGFRVIRSAPGLSF